jgi:predicted amidohydrolase YtcJ
MRDLLVIGALHTLDPARPRAAAALVRNGRFAKVGERAECEAAGKGAERVELGRGSAVPGLVDAHGHVAWLGRGRLEVACAGAASADECARRVAERARALPAGSWIRGRGWDQNRWPGGADPDADVLSRIVPDHPAFLTRVDGHAAWVNRAALAAAGIGPGTADPPGGRIARDASGRATGLLVDGAMELVLGRLPRPTAAELEAAILAGLGELARLGLTGVHDAGVDPAGLDVYGHLADDGRLPIHVYAMIDGTPPLDRLRSELARWQGGIERGKLAVRAVKLFADGALGSRGAALLEDYADAPGERGLLLEQPAVLRAKLEAAVAAGLQPCVHAIGDRATREVLRALVTAGPAARTLRPRVEHLQILLPADLPILRASGAIASMQPVHAASDGPWVPVRLGAGTERLRGAYAWRAAADAGAVLAFGSDFPVETPDPRAGLHAAETRRTRDGATFLREQAVSRAEALRAFTTGAAWASFAEDRRGMIREGLEADLTAFAEDVLAVPADALPALTVTHTIVGGRVVWARG